MQGRASKGRSGIDWAMRAVSQALAAILTCCTAGAAALPARPCTETESKESLKSCLLSHPMQTPREVATECVEVCNDTPHSSM